MAATFVVCVVGGAPILGPSDVAIAQEVPSAAAGDEVPAVFQALQGTWEGRGTLLGRPGAFDMEWQITRDGFVRLSFSNAWVDDQGIETPVLSAHAVYYPLGTSATGVWQDDRPQRITLEAVVTDSSVVTTWTAESETGRTEYVVRSADEVVVRDFVMVDGAERPFADATYRRAGSSGRS